MAEPIGGANREIALRIARHAEPLPVQLPLDDLPDRTVRVLALTRYSGRAASTRQRFMQFVPALAAAGVDVTFSPLLDDDYVANIGRSGRKSSAMLAAYLRRARTLALEARSYDALWVQYDAFPFLPGIFERALAAIRRPYVVDYDDAIFHNYDLAGSALRRRLLANKMRPLLARARTCVAGNAYIAEYASRYCADTIVVPTVVDTQKYQPLPERRPGALRVGWIGSPSTWRYVEPLLETLLPTLRAYGAELHVVGARPDGERDGIRFIDWSEDTEIAAVQSFDIGIMPLADDPWARGKCGYKLIQYMGCGVPCIASPVGVNREIVTSGVNGLLASSPREWRDALATLLADGALRAAMGRVGRDKVVARYSLASQIEPVTAVFSRLRG